jgi:hypothetical protein
MNMLKVVIPSLLVSLTSIAMIACDAPTMPSEVNSQSEMPETVYRCSNLYLESALQTDPLWSETYDYDPNGDAQVKFFGVSPSDGTYFSSIARNQEADNSGGIAISIGNSEKGLTSTAIFPLGTSQLMALLQTSPSADLMVVCDLVGK